tara:strand:+ start:2293 stop:2787 length:495 start_codon:yes stop_codon:yes gene_type:complete
MADKPKYPIGPSLAAIAWADIETSSRKGTPLVRFTIQGKAGEALDKTIYKRCYLTPGSSWQLEDISIAVGADADKMLAAAQSGDTTTIIAAFIDKPLKVVVKADEYTDAEGITREGREIVAIESLDANIRAFMDKRRKARMTGGSIAASTAPNNSSNDNGDIPF